ncbi:hypothetical protein SKAU_G00006800 [Synaphobranchus kaupii]|uniref:Uncharacterized protein n=1 Tax=Synaphobranchus kaupii TaxID=118154 RepID=A0A9Q1JCX7_SYNKA|nr:hypothetical protein SKAU_G00006800 [Synaphobranchus kaupii]
MSQSLLARADCGSASALNVSANKAPLFTEESSVMRCRSQPGGAGGVRRGRGSGRDSEMRVSMTVHSGGGQGLPKGSSTSSCRKSQLPGIPGPIKEVSSMGAFPTGVVPTKNALTLGHIGENLSYWRRPYEKTEGESNWNTAKSSDIGPGIRGNCSFDESRRN